MHEHSGLLQAKGFRFAIIVARFNELITKSLLEGALDSLRRHGADENKITVVWVPGALEVPVAAKALAESKKYDAIICLGAVIRGATAHFDVVVGQSASGIAQVALSSGIPVLNGILTPDSIEQALERAGTKAGNKGFDVASAAVEMANVMKGIKFEKA